MRILRALGIAVIALLTSSCSTAVSEAGDTRAPVPSVSPTPTPSPAEATTPPSDPRALVEAASLARCDAQGVARYPDGFVSQRTSAAPEGVWQGEQYRVSYLATVTLPPVAPDLPPEQRLVRVACSVEDRGGSPAVTSWSAT